MTLDKTPVSVDAEHLVYIYTDTPDYTVSVAVNGDQPSTQNYGLSTSVNVQEEKFDGDSIVTVLDPNIGTAGSPRYIAEATTAGAAPAKGERIAFSLPKSSVSKDDEYARLQFVTGTKLQKNNAANRHGSLSDYDLSIKDTPTNGRGLMTLDPRARTFRYEYYGADVTNISDTFSFRATDGERTNTISANLADSIVADDHKKNNFTEYTEGFPSLRVMNETAVYDPVQPMVLTIESDTAFLTPQIELYWNKVWVNMGTITSDSTTYTITYDAAEKVRVTDGGNYDVFVNGVKLNATPLSNASGDLSTGLTMETMLMEIRVNSEYNWASGPSPKVLMWWNGQWTSVGSLTEEENEILNRGEIIQRYFSIATKLKMRHAALDDVILRIFINGELISETNNADATNQGAQGEGWLYLVGNKTTYDYREIDKGTLSSSHNTITVTDPRGDLSEAILTLRKVEVASTDTSSELTRVAYFKVEDDSANVVEQEWADGTVSGNLDSIRNGIEYVPIGADHNVVGGVWTSTKNGSNQGFQLNNAVDVTGGASQSVMVKVNVGESKLDVSNWKAMSNVEIMPNFDGPVVQGITSQTSSIGQPLTATFGGGWMGSDKTALAYRMSGHSVVFAVIDGSNLKMVLATYQIGTWTNVAARYASWTMRTTVESTSATVLSKWESGTVGSISDGTSAGYYVFNISGVVASGDVSARSILSYDYRHTYGACRQRAAVHQHHRGDGKPESGNVLRMGPGRRTAGRAHGRVMHANNTYRMSVAGTPNRRTTTGPPSGFMFAELPAPLDMSVDADIQQTFTASHELIQRHFRVGITSTLTTSTTRPT